MLGNFDYKWQLVLYFRFITNCHFYYSYINKINLFECYFKLVKLFIFDIYIYISMLYQLSTGYTIELSLEDYLAFSDEELRLLISTNYGIQINNPRYGSAINKPGKKETILPENLSERDIKDISQEEKILDQDFKLDED